MKEKVTWFLINENYGANLAPFAFHFDADYHGFKKILGVGATHQSVGIFDGFLQQAYGIEPYNKVARATYKKLSQDKKFAKLMLSNVYRLCDEFYKFNKSILRSDLGALTNRQLAVNFEKFYQYFYDLSTWSVPFSYTEYGIPLWTNHLTDYLNNLKIPLGHTSLEIYQILTSSKRKTITAREKEDLLKLAVRVKRSRVLSKIFKLPVDNIARELSLKQNNFFKDINKHTNKYCWINFGFEGPLQDNLYFITAIKDWQSKDPATELKNEEKLRATIYQRQQKLFKKLKVDTEHRWLFWVVREYGFQKTYRKDIEYFSYYIYHTKLLSELSRRLDITLKQGHYLLMPEIQAILKKRKKVDQHELNRRIKACFYVIDGGKSRLLVGKEAVAFNKKIKARPVPKGLKELKGQCACQGRVRAIVKVIRKKEDYSKFRAGDILVSYATNPNMVPLMKRAAAIITDEGGVTCHAAIVSRELNIPCVKRALIMR